MLTLPRENECVRRVQQQMVVWQSDPKVMSALGSAAAIKSVESGQQFEPVTHRQFDGHNVSNIVNAVFGPHVFLVDESDARQEVLSLYKAMHEYRREYEKRLESALQ